MFCEGGEFMLLENQRFVGCCEETETKYCANNITDCDQCVDFKDCGGLEGATHCIEDLSKPTGVKAVGCSQDYELNNGTCQEESELIEPEPSDDCTNGKYAQCGGQGWQGPTCCQANLICEGTIYWKQCVPENH